MLAQFSWPFGNLAALAALARPGFGMMDTAGLDTADNLADSLAFADNLALPDRLRNSVVAHQLLD